MSELTKELGLGEVLQLSYFRSTAWSFYNQCLSLANESSRSGNGETSRRTEQILSTLDDNAENIFSPKLDFTDCKNEDNPDHSQATCLHCHKIDWRIPLSHSKGDMKHYMEFLAFKKEGCKVGWVVGRDGCKCKECSKNRSYDPTKPSSLLKLIRNVDQHAPEKTNYYPKGVIEMVLYPEPEGYCDKQAFVEYWLEWFPKLFPFMASLEKRQEKQFDWSQDCVADQAVEMLWSAFKREKFRAENLVKSYVCKLYDGKQFNLDVLLLEAENPRQIEGVLNTFVKVEDRFLTVQHGSSKPLKYKLSPLNRKTFNLITSIDLLKNENCEKVERVILLVESNGLHNEVERRLRQFARFIHAAELEGYVDRFLFEHEENLDDFSPMPDTVYLVFDPHEKCNWYWDFEQTVLRLDDFMQCAVKPTIEGQLILSNENFYSLKRLTSDVVVYVGKIFSYELASNSLKKLCAGRSLKIIRIHVDAPSKNAKFIKLTPERDLISGMSDKLLFVSAGAGEGKTALLEHLLFTSSLAEVKLCHTTARNLLKSRRDSHIEAIQLSVAPLKFDSVDGVLLLIDAMDEVEMEAESIIYLKTITHDLAHLPYFKVIVTMRSYLEGKIRKEFPTSKIFKLAALAEDEEMRIILNYWKSTEINNDNHTRGVLGSKSEEDFSRISELGLSDAAQRIVNDTERRFQLTPLHCRLLAEIYLEQLIQTNDFSLEHSVIEIYEKIVLKNFERYLLEKNDVKKENLNRQIYEGPKKEYYFAHVYLALKQLHPQHVNSLKKVLQHPKIELTPGQGFLHNIDPVLFTHRVFAEYFVDQWAFQVVRGCLNLNEKDLRQFSRFFMVRYLKWKENHFFLNTMLEEHGAPICFNFKLDAINIQRLLKMSGNSVTRLIATSFAVESPQLVLKALNESEGPVVSQLLNFSLSGGHYDMVRLLIESKWPDPIPSKVVHNEHSKFNQMLSLVQRKSYSNLELNQKKRIIDLLVARYLPIPNFSFVDGASQDVPRGVEFELFRYSIDRIKKQIKPSGHEGEQVLQNVFLQRDSYRNNLLHRNQDFPEFLHGFREEFGKAFYTLANSINREGKIYSATLTSNEALVEVDYCIKLFNGDLKKVNETTIACQLSVKSSYSWEVYESNLLNLLKAKESWCDPSLLSLRRTNLIGDRVSEKIQTGAFDTLLDAFKVCAEIDNCDPQRIEEATKSFPSCNDELSPYYVAVHIRNRLRHKSSSDHEDFQDWLIGNVLATEGVKFKYPMCCHLLNDLIADVLNEDVDFKLSAKHVEAMCVNDSSFIVACKSANANIAKLLAKSFTVEWMSCLEDFQLMCVFRALDQHCGGLLEQIVDKLAAQNFSVPIKTVQESLITGNLRLLKLYVEKLRFADVIENTHLILESSKYDDRVIIQRKKDMIEFIRVKFPESFVGIKCSWNSPPFESVISGRDIDDRGTRLIYEVDLGLIPYFKLRQHDKGENY